MPETRGERLAWLDHCLSDADCARLYTRAQMAAMNEEREFLRELLAERRAPPAPESRKDGHP